ncbi:MAG: transglycosylase domain-containing protein, partial [Candidatus Shapirobacteria bacterium]|nr:transglycosylase domain-containing protein [Candidatus Shapirobacteria bacterium]
KWATIASEDKNFYKHHGFDFGGILRASYNIVFQRTLQGGSTITQLLVKNALLEDPNRTLRRKIREALLTYGTEVIYSKDQILEMYLNQAPYGGTSWGIEAAAQNYFNKQAKDLTLSEATLLAGLPASPTRFSPFGAHPELAKERQKRVLNMMVEDKYITQEEVQKASDEELKYAPNDVGIKAPHFVLYIKDLLVDQYGEKTAEQGGLIDLDLQNFAQQTMATEVGKLKNLHITNGAALTTNPKTGEILAMVGSKDYFDKNIDGNVNVTLQSRQPGSSIKPLNYALAMEKKLITPATVLNDVPTCFAVPGQKLYCPVNYDNTFHGPIQARFALGSSYNIPAVKVLTLNGLEDFVKKANEMGISTFTDPKNYGLSLTLGGGEVKMIDMATAFSSFANLGLRQDLWAIKKVEDSHGKVLFEKKEVEEPRTLPMEVAYLISHILLDNNARSAAFGPSSFLVLKNHPEVSVKTGTTNDRRDNWTIGYNASRLTVVWVGNNDNTPMSYVASGITGASPIWNKIMNYALKDQKQEWPIKPDDVVGASICTLSGKLPNPDQPCETRFEYFLAGTVPTEVENLKTQIEVDKTTHQLATDKTPPENKEIQEHPVIFDPLGIPFCLDCTFPTESVTINPNALSSPTQIPSLNQP